MNKYLMQLNVRNLKDMLTHYDIENSELMSKEKKKEKIVAVIQLQKEINKLLKGIKNYKDF